MPNLAEFYRDGEFTGGRAYLPAGQWHNVKVRKYHNFAYHNGNPGVEYHVMDSQGRGMKISFALAGKGPNRLAWFCRTFGLSKEDAGKFDIEKADAHEVMIDKGGMVFVDKVNGFGEIVAWEPTGTNVNGDIPASAMKAKDESIPF